MSKFTQRFKGPTDAREAERLMAASDADGRLENLWERWVKKYRDMSESPQFRGRVCPPHITVKPEGYDPVLLPGILYVGKALGGAPPDGPVSVIQADVDDFFRRMQGGERFSDFWGFARQLSKQIAGQSPSTGMTSLQNLVWTNIFKIGSPTKKPPVGAIQAAQRELAIETLQVELQAFRPKLVAWVTGSYGMEVVRAVAEDANDERWSKEQEDIGLWYRPSIGSFPAMIRTKHPQGKKRIWWQAWIETACKLISD